jgi:3-methyladenine DNA glycosylase AlkD
VSSAARLHRDLLALRNPASAAALQRFFKTAPGEYGAGDRFLGISVPELRRLARTHEALALRDIAGALKSPWHEERLATLFIMVRRYDRAAPSEREAIHGLYLRSRKWINNWDLVDSSAEQIVGAHLKGADRRLLRELARSKRLWDRRIAMIATLHYIRHGEYAPTLDIARTLLRDEHDLIRKAVGWMLREVGKRDRAAEEEFLRRHAHGMPRTMLRYAIEHFSPARRRRYLAAKAPL